jgi:hypothetical protein
MSKHKRKRRSFAVAAQAGGARQTGGGSLPFRAELPGERQARPRVGGAVKEWCPYLSTLWTPEETVS